MNTLKILNSLLRQAKSAGARRGILSLRRFFGSAGAEKVGDSSKPFEKPWLKHLGKLRTLRNESKLVEDRVQEAFEEIDPELWN